MTEPEVTIVPNPTVTDKTEPSKTPDDKKGDEKANWIPPHRLKEESEKRRVVEDQLKKYQDAEADVTKKKLEEKGEYDKALDIEKTKRETSENELLKYKTTNILRKELSKHVKVSDPVQREANIDLLLPSINLDNLEIKDGVITGLDKQIEGMKGTFATLFESGTTTADPTKTTTSATPGVTKVGTLKTAEDVNKLSDAQVIQALKEQGIKY